MSVPQVAVESAQFLMSHGVSKDVAVGIVSVLYAGESGLNPGSQGVQSTETGGVLNPQGAYGIASWNGPRQPALQAFALQKNMPVGELNTQLLFVLTESANSYPRVWAAIQNPIQTYATFIPVFVEVYENPAQPAAEIARAQAFAATLYPAVPAAVPPVPTPVIAGQAATVPAQSVTPTPTTSTYVPSPTPVPVMDPMLAAILTTVVEALISGLLKATMTQTAGAPPVVVTPTPAVPLVNAANLAQEIAAILPAILAQVQAKP